MGGNVQPLMCNTFPLMLLCSVSSSAAYIKTSEECTAKQVQHSLAFFVSPAKQKHKDSGYDLSLLIRISLSGSVHT